MSWSKQRWFLRQDSECVVIDAAAEAIYDLVADMPRMGEWSPECARVEWTDGATGPAVGARFVGHNRGGPLGSCKWSRHGTVLTADRGREFAFATEEGGREGTVWRYRFEPADGGTRVTESYTVEWIPTWARIVDVPTNRHRELVEAMRHTLEQLKTAAESVDHRRSTSRDHHLPAAPDIDVVTSTVDDPRLRHSSDQRVRAARRRTDAGRHRRRRRGRRVHDRAADGHRSRPTCGGSGSLTPTSITSARCTDCSTRTRSSGSSPPSSGSGSWGSRRHRSRWTGCTS